MLDIREYIVQDVPTKVDQTQNIPWRGLRGPDDWKLRWDAEKMVAVRAIWSTFDLTRALQDVGISRTSVKRTVDIDKPSEST